MGQDKAKCSQPQHSHCHSGASAGENDVHDLEANPGKASEQAFADLHSNRQKSNGACNVYKPPCDPYAVFFLLVACGEPQLMDASCLNKVFNLAYFDHGPHTRETILTNTTKILEGIPSVNRNDAKQLTVECKELLKTLEQLHALTMAEKNGLDNIDYQQKTKRESPKCSPLACAKLQFFESDFSCDIFNDLVFLPPPEFNIRKGKETAFNSILNFFCDAMLECSSILKDSSVITKCSSDSKSTVSEIENSELEMKTDCIVVRDKPNLVSVNDCSKFKNDRKNDDGNWNNKHLPVSKSELHCNSNYQPHSSQGKRLDENIGDDNSNCLADGSACVHFCSSKLSDSQESVTSKEQRESDDNADVECSNMCSEDMTANKQLVSSEETIKVPQVFPPGSSLPNLTQPYISNPIFHAAICEQTSHSNFTPECFVVKDPQNCDQDDERSLFRGPPSFKSKLKASKFASKQQHSTKKSSKTKSHPVEAIDNSRSTFHLGHLLIPLEILKKAVSSRVFNGCCTKHKIMEHFVTGVTQRTPLMRSFAEGHSDLVRNNTEVEHVAPSDLTHPAGQRENESQPKAGFIKRSEDEEKDTKSERTYTGQQHEEFDFYQSTIKTASQLLHVPDYERMHHVLHNGFQTYPPDLPPELLIAFHFGCGLSEYKRGQLQGAAQSFSQCESIALSADRYGDVALASLYRGDIEILNHSYPEAISNYTTAVENYSKCGAVANIDTVAHHYKMVVPSLSIFNSKLGAAYRSASKPVDAIKWYLQAIENSKLLLLSTSDTKVTSVKKDQLAAHTSLGNLYQGVGENSKALEQYEVSVSLATELRDYISLGWAHGNMGNAYLGLHQKDKALYHLEKALELALEHEPTPQAIGRTYNNLGTAYQSMNDLNKAEEYYDLALSQAIYGDDKPGQARVYGNIGNVLMLRKDFEKAIPHYSEVLQLSNDSSTLSTALHNRGCAHYEWAESLRAEEKKEGRYYLYGNDFDDSEPECRPPNLSPAVISHYQKGQNDLMEVLKYHEESLESIKGSPKGLSLSVSLFESNSRTFHRLQDCLVGLGEWQRALSVAEQCRARTLGELMLKNRSKTKLATPLSLESIINIAEATDSIIVYCSYTGARILIWVFVPINDETKSHSMAMFEVPVYDEQFDGKSFDYYLKYSLTEELVEHTFEMYNPADLSSTHNEPMKNLYKLVGEPLVNILSKLLPCESSQTVRKIVVVPDSYTSLLPFTCLLNSEDNSFLGDNFRFSIMPSLLTIGLVDQLTPVAVEIPADSHNVCVVGNPKIPPFDYNGDTWNLGNIPFAEKEAEWVGYKLNASPVVRQNATKNAVKMRIMNAKIIHIATHGSASLGFLAFAGMVSSRNREVAASKDVLLYPDEVEKLKINPALVVLSSCDSGRGTVKADGIQGMARAFILAGAQAVLTTLWRVPDESASVFMQLFYQFLLDGYPVSDALHKAILSLRCFSKYSDYIHWSGYQLTGRDTRIILKKTKITQLIDQRLGRAGAFTRLNGITQLENAFIKDPNIPSDVQILRGTPGLRPSAILKDFVHTFHEHFYAGIFLINCRTTDIIDASVRYIEKEIGMDICKLNASENQQALVILDNVTTLPSSDKLLRLMENRHVHIIFTSKSTEHLDKLIKEVDKKLIRGCAVHRVEPLSKIESTQHIVHSVMKERHLAPNKEDQEIFEKLAEFTSGSPVLVEVATNCLLTKLRENEHEDTHSLLVDFSEEISLDCSRNEREGKLSLASKEDEVSFRRISGHVKEMPSIQNTVDGDVWVTNAEYDSWDSIEELVNSCALSPEERLLLNSLCIFNCSPIPYSLVYAICSKICVASEHPHRAVTLTDKLLKFGLMKKYPSPVILHSSLTTSVNQLLHKANPEFVYVPQFISQSIWKNLEAQDRIVALSLMYQALLSLLQSASDLDACFMSGLCVLLLEVYECDFNSICADPNLKRECYKASYELYMKYKLKAGAFGRDNLWNTIYFHDSPPQADVVE